MHSNVLVGTQQFPVRVVQVRLRPTQLAVRVVAGVEAPEAMKFGHLDAIPFQV
jgi:hypothetical protein